MDYQHGFLGARFERSRREGLPGRLHEKPPRNPWAHSLEMSSSMLQT